MPTASATAARIQRAARLTMRGSSGQQHYDRAGAALVGTRLHEREHLVAPREQLADASPQHRLAALRAKPLAVDDAHATKSRTPRLGQELRRRQRRLGGVHAVQVEVVL